MCSYEVRLMIDKCCLSQVQSWRHDMYVAGPPKIRGNIVEVCTLFMYSYFMPKLLWSYQILENLLTIVNDWVLYNKEKEQCLLPCIMLNLGVSKLPSYHCSNFICYTTCMGFAFVHSWLSRGCLCHSDLEYCNIWSCSKDCAQANNS